LRAGVQYIRTLKSA